MHAIEQVLPHLCALHSFLALHLHGLVIHACRNGASKLVPEIAPLIASVTYHDPH